MMPSVSEGRKAARAAPGHVSAAPRAGESRAEREGFEKPRPSSSLPPSSVRNSLQLFHVIPVIETSTKTQQFQRKETKSEGSYHDANEYFLEGAAF